MKRIFVFVLILMVITACQPSEQAIQQAIAETEAARPTETAIPPTVTLTMTITPTFTMTATPTMEYCNLKDVNSTRDKLLNPLLKIIEILQTAETVDSALEFTPLQKDLLKIQMDILLIDYPPCFENAFTYLNESIDLMSDGFEVAINGDWNSGANKINLSGEYLILSTEEVQKIIDCVPNCKP